MNISSIRNSMRVLAATSGFVLTVGAAAAFASDAIGTNNTTGANSENINETTVHHTQTIRVRRTATVRTPVTVHFNSGNSDVHHNTTVASVTNGDVAVTGAIDNNVNTGDSLSSADITSSTSDSFDGLNSTTGANSRNINRSTIKRNLYVTDSSTANLTNTIRARLNSGDNDIHHNTTVGAVSGGDIRFNFDVANTANTAGADWSALVDHSSDQMFMGTNDATGSSSENINTSTVHDTTRVHVTRTANVNNSFNITGNSGGNDINNNTTVGAVQGGNISVDLSVANDVN